MRKNVRKKTKNARKCAQIYMAGAKMNAGGGIWPGVIEVQLGENIEKSTCFIISGVVDLL
jgi:hypothetical protein